MSRSRGNRQRIPAEAIVVRATCTQQERVLADDASAGAMWHDLRISRVLRGSLTDTLVAAQSDDYTYTTVSHGRAPAPRLGETLDLVLVPLGELPTSQSPLLSKAPSDTLYRIHNLVW